MAALTFATFKTRLALNNGNLQAADPYFAYLGDYVNDALNHLPLHVVNKDARNYDLFPELHKRWTILTTQDQAWIDLSTSAADCLAPQLVYSFDSSSVPDLSTSERKPVQYVGNAIYELLPKSSAVTGYPKLWSHEGKYLYLHPTPRVGYTTYVLLKGIQQEVDLVNGTDTPVMDKRWHTAVLDYACYLLATDMGMLDDARRFLSSCDQKIATAVSLVGTRQRRSSVVVKGDTE